MRRGHDRSDEPRDRGEGARGLTIRVPGKVMLFGEYGVVEGPPQAALLAGVARFATCRVELGGAEVSITTTGLSTPAPPGDPRLVFVEQALAHCALRPPGRYALDTTEFHTLTETGGPTKLGLGSSAAVTVALLGALHAAAGEDLDEPTIRASIFAEALAAHRAASGGGSGADVAACTYGGLLRYSLGDAGESIEPGLRDSLGDIGESGGGPPSQRLFGRAPGAAAPPRVERIEASLAPLGLVFAGLSADTRLLLRQVRGLRARIGAAEWQAHMTALDLARRQAEAALAAGNDGRWRRAVTDGRVALEALGAATGAPLRGPAQTADAVDRLARRFGGSWKTTGAGGGDLYWVVTPPECPLAEVEAAAGVVGLHWLSLPISPEGVHVVRG